MQRKQRGERYQWHACLLSRDVMPMYSCCMVQAQTRACERPGLNTALSRRGEARETLKRGRVKSVHLESPRHSQRDANSN